MHSPQLGLKQSHASIFYNFTLWFQVSNVSELEDIIHPCELKLLERVLVIANDYTTVKQFVETNLYDGIFVAQKTGNHFVSYFINNLPILLPS